MDIIPFLKSAMAMLDGCNKDKVECAKILLGELVKAMEAEPAKVKVGCRANHHEQEREIVSVDDELDPQAIAAKEELLP
jgi:hypothetical protein